MRRAWLVLMLLERTRSTYEVPLTMGQDLVIITIEANGVSAEARQP